VPEPQRGELGRFLAACAAAALEFRWSATSNLHLTLRFLGGVDRAVAEGIADRLGENGGPSFELELGALGSFKRGRLARVVWLGLRSGGEAASTLAARIETECVNAGLEPELRALQPHLTLARARPREGASLPELPPVPELGGWVARELVLYQSRLTKTGAVHEPVRSIALGA
jgi:2'-5' RNA ligase